MKWCCPVLICVLLGACSTDNIRRNLSWGAADFSPDSRPLATTLVYDCNGYEFIARLGPGEMALWLPDRYVILSQVRSASGTEYREGDIMFWSKGEEAMLTIAGQDYFNCHLLPKRVPWEDARRRGVDFRAVGNEPGWFLEVRNGQQLLFVADLGMQRIMVPDTGGVMVGPARVHHGATDTQDLRVEIMDEPCIDSMSGDTFPNRVQVTLNGTTYHGCGQPLEYPW